MHTFDPLVVGNLVVASVTAVAAYLTLRDRHLPGARAFGVANVVPHDVAAPLSVIRDNARLVEMADDADHVSEIYEATDR